jgi:hypothetical protein
MLCPLGGLDSWVMQTASPPPYSQDDPETTVLGFFVVLPSSTHLFTVGVEGFYFHLITLKHPPYLVGPSGRGIGLLQRRLSDNTNTVQETNINVACGIRTPVPASVRAQTYALDRAATGISLPHYY